MKMVMIVNSQNPYAKYSSKTNKMTSS